MDWKNKTAILYKRVSTEEQADKGYSLADQSDRLTNFCTLFNITIAKVFTDDYSAKTFERPGWKEMMVYVQTGKRKANLLLFTNWSRFSRSENIGETYMMIDTLERMGISPQAIEQPLDFTIPENRLILAFYVASPMVENMRRSSNIRNGIRRANKEGRWCNNAPVGYSHGRDDQNKPLIKINPITAPIIASIFTEYLEGREPQLIIHRAKQRGLKTVGHGTFQRIITNPLYAGLVRVRATKEEPEQIVKGLHEPIISEDIFYAVQNKWNGNNRSKGRIYDEGLPLRGILRCDSCGGLFTGGRSRGKSGRYWNYYRCLRCTGHNFSTETSHRQLSEVLSAISLKPEHITDLIANVDKSMKEIIKRNSHEAETLSKEIKGIEEKLNSLETKYIGNQIDFGTYQKYYPIYREGLAEKRLRLEALSGDQESIIELYRAALPRMTNLQFLYDKCSLENKQQLLRLIFTGGLYKLKNGGYRTPETLSLFAVQNNTVKGLVIADKQFTITNAQTVEGNQVKSNPVEALLRFVLKIAA